MFGKILGLGFGLSLAFAGLATAPAIAEQKEVIEGQSPEATSTLLASEEIVSADADTTKNEEVAAQPASLEGAFSFIPLNHVEAASADASNQEEEAPQALAAESNTIVRFKRMKEPVLAQVGRPTVEKSAPLLSNERILKSRQADISAYDDFWEKNKKKEEVNQEDTSSISSSEEVIAVPKAEAPTEQPNPPPQDTPQDTMGESEQAETLESVEETKGNNQDQQPEEEGETSELLEEIVPADESEVDSDPLESIQEAQEGDAPSEVSVSAGVTNVGGEEDAPTFETGVGYAEGGFGVEVTTKSPLEVKEGESGATAVDAELTAPVSDLTSISLEAEDLLAENGTVLKARADIQATSALIVSPGVEHSTDVNTDGAPTSDVQFNIGAALQATDTLGFALELEDLASKPVFKVEGNFVQEGYEVIARVNDLTSNLRTFDLEAAVQIVRWTRAQISAEDIFGATLVGTGLELQLDSSIKLNLGADDVFGSPSYEFQLEHTFRL